MNADRQQQCSFLVTSLLKDHTLDQEGYDIINAQMTNKAYIIGRGI
jgi:hypothetical protein